METSKKLLGIKSDIWTTIDERKAKKKHKRCQISTTEGTATEWILRTGQISQKEDESRQESLHRKSGR